MDIFDQLQEESNNLSARLEQEDQRKLMEDIWAYLDRLETESAEVSMPEQRDQLYADLRFWSQLIYEKQNVFPKKQLRPISEAAKAQSLIAPLEVSLTERKDLRKLEETLDRVKQFRSLGKLDETKSLQDQIWQAQEFFNSHYARQIRISENLRSDDLKTLADAYQELLDQLQNGLIFFYDFRREQGSAWIKLRDILEESRSIYYQVSDVYYRHTIQQLEQDNLDAEQARNILRQALNNPYLPPSFKSRLSEEQPRLEQLISNKEKKKDEKQRSERFQKDWKQAGSNLEKLLAAASEPALLSKTIRPDFDLACKQAFDALQSNLKEIRQSNDLGKILEKFDASRRQFQALERLVSELPFAEMKAAIPKLHVELDRLDTVLGLVKKERSLLERDGEEWYSILKADRFQGIEEKAHSLINQTSELLPGMSDVFASIQSQANEWKIVRAYVVDKIAEVKQAFEGEKFDLVLELTQTCEKRPAHLDGLASYVYVDEEIYPKIVRGMSGFLQVVDLSQTEGLKGWKAVAQAAKECRDEIITWRDRNQKANTSLERVSAKLKATQEKHTATMTDAVSSNKTAEGAPNAKPVTLLELLKSWETVLETIKKAFEEIQKDKPVSRARSTTAEEEMQKGQGVYNQFLDMLDMAQRNIQELNELIADPLRGIPDRSMLEAAARDKNVASLSELISQYERAGFRNEQEKQIIAVYKSKLDTLRYNRLQRAWQNFSRWMERWLSRR